MTHVVVPQNLLILGITTLDLLTEGFHPARYLVFVVLVFCAGASVFFFARARLPTPAAYANAFFLFLIATYSAATTGATHAASMAAYLYVVLVAGVLADNTASYIFGAASMVASTVVVLLYRDHILTQSVSDNPLRELSVVLLILLLSIVLQIVARRSFDDATEKVNLELAERRRTEVALRQSQEHLSQFAQGSFDGLNIVDDGKILEANEQLALMFGYTIEDLNGRDTLDLVAPEDHDLAAELRKTREAVADLTGIRKDGSRFPIEIRRHPMNYYGKPVQVIAVRDMSAVREAQAKGIIAEHRYRDLFENVRDAVFALDHDGKIVSLNRAFELSTNLAVGDWIGKPFYQLLHPDDIALARSAVEQIFSREREQTALFELRVRRADGTYLTAEIVISPLRDGGSITTILGIARDVGERKTLEEQLRRMQRLDSLGALAGGIAHDLNNILSPILTAAQLLRTSLANLPDEELASIVERSARRGSEIVRQILTFARGNAGERSEVNPKYAIGETVSLVVKTFPKNIEIRRDVARDIRLVRGDVTQLQQILMNLAVNARDAMPEGGALTISARNIEIGRGAGSVDQFERVDPGEYVEIAVEDTGIGMSEEVRRRIFEPFFTTKERGKGTGLGLTTVASIVREFGGSLAVSSTVGLGTTFRLLIPALPRVAPDSESEARSEILRGHGEKILIVDDELSIQQICREALEAYNYSVSTASNASEAIAALAAEPSGAFSVLLTDLNMPTMDGAGLMNVARRMDPAIVVVTMSGTYHESVRNLGVSEAVRRAASPRAGIANDSADVAQIVETPKTANTANTPKTANTASEQPLFLPKPFTAEKLLRVIYGAILSGTVQKP